MSRTHCVVTRRLPGAAVERLRDAHDVTVWPGELPPSRRELAAIVADADGLLCLLTERIDAGVLDEAPRLRAISNYAVGVDNIDVPEATRRGIAVGNTPDALTDATAELAIALLLGRARQLVEADAYVRAGRWQTWEPRGFLGASISGSTLTVVGPGRIGRAVARRAEGLGMRVLEHGRGDDRDRLREAFGESDFVSLHCPLTPQTAGLIDAETLGWLKDGAVLVNTARGGLVDLEALVDALEAGRLGGAALDTTDPEPLPAHHRLLHAPRVTITPHIGSATRVAREAMADAAVDNLLRALGGEEMRYPVNTPGHRDENELEGAR